MDPARENRVLRVVVVLLLCVVLAGAVSGRQAQRLPGPGAGIVDVNITNEPRVNAVQQGEWRVAQQGDWRVGVQGTVATLPPMPSVIAVGRTYYVRWSDAAEHQRITIRTLEPSGWASVDADGRSRWVNLARAVSIETR
jgi:hypothetical protein